MKGSKGCTLQDAYCRVVYFVCELSRVKERKLITVNAFDKKLAKLQANRIVGEEHTAARARGVYIHLIKNSSK